MESSLNWSCVWQLLVAVVLLGWLAEFTDGYVAGCTWHAHIVSTADADKHNPPVVHNATPGAPPMDITNDIRNLAITGIKMDNEVSGQTIV